MSDFLIMRSFLNQSEPTVAKVRRDGIMMYCEARYVIVLNDHGEVIERINRSITYTGNFLVVLAPVVYKGWKINLSVVLEIGLSRSVPYQQFEKNFTDGKFAVKGRRPITKLSDDYMLGLLPTLAEILSEIAIKSVLHWKDETINRDFAHKFFLSKIGTSISRGIFISIPKEELMLIYASLLRDLVCRKYLVSKRVSGIRRFIRSYVRSGANYSPKKFRSYTGAQKLWQMLRNGKYSKHYLDYIFSFLSNRERDIVEEILRAFVTKEFKKQSYICEERLRVLSLSIYEILEAESKIDNFDELESIFKEEKKLLTDRFDVHIVYHPNRDDQRGSHGQNCFRVEIVPDINIVRQLKEKTK